MSLLQCEHQFEGFRIKFIRKKRFVLHLPPEKFIIALKVEFTMCFSVCISLVKNYEKPNRIGFDRENVMSNRIGPNAYFENQSRIESNRIEVLEKRIESSRKKIDRIWVESNRIDIF